MRVVCWKLIVIFKNRQANMVVCLQGIVEMSMQISGKKYLLLFARLFLHETIVIIFACPYSMLWYAYTIEIIYLGDKKLMCLSILSSFVYTNFRNTCLEWWNTIVSSTIINSSNLIFSLCNNIH